MKGLGRYVPFLQVGLVLCIGVMLLLWFTAPMVRRSTPVIFPDQALLRRLTALSYRAAREAPQNTAVIIGHSSATEGFELARLSAETPWRWTNQATWGAGQGSFKALDLNLAPLFESGLRPATIVVGVHAMSTGKEVWPDLARDYRNLANAWLTRLALKVQGEGYARDESHDPWAEISREIRFRSEDQIQAWSESLRLDPSVYTEDSPEVDAMRAVLSKLEARTDRLLVVKMPESTVLRSRTPEQAMALLDKTLSGFEVIDCRDLLSDEEFADLLHPNELGRKKLTDRILSTLNP